LQGVLYPLYVLAEIAIIATDLAELLGSAIALNLYISVPEPDGIDVEGMLIIVSIFSI
jgi:Mn2+/Fe2+ NRAMP family transporter